MPSQMQRVKLQITAVEVRHRLNLSGRGFLDLLKKMRKNLRLGIDLLETELESIFSSINNKNDRIMSLRNYWEVVKWQMTVLIIAIKYAISGKEWQRCSRMTSHRTTNRIESK